MEFKGEMSLVVGSSCVIKQVRMGNTREVLYFFVFSAGPYMTL
jgi:hypothetical protein